MTRKAWRLGLAGVALYLLFLLATAPAGLAAWAVGKLSGQAAVLELPEGSLWSGRAKALHVSTPTGRYTLAEVKWRLRGWSLLKGEAAVVLEYGGGGRLSHGTVAVGWHRLRLEAVEASLPLPLLLYAVPAWRGYPLAGDALLRTRGFALGPGGGEGEAEVDWLGLASPLSRVNPMGDYRLRLAGAKDGVTLSLATVRGPLRLDGSGRWSQPDGLRFAGTASADPGRREELAPLLGTLGRDRGDGVYLIGLGGGTR